MERSSLSFYERFARRRWPRSYRGKFLLVAFVGTHVPLLAVVAYAFFAFGSFTAWPVLGVLLGATVVGVAGTFAALHYLLKPIPYTARALRRYADESELPDLPVRYEDEVGHLMRDTQSALAQLDALARFRDRLFGVVVHDLRSPATSALLAADVLEDVLDGTPQQKEGTELVDMIRQSTQQQLAFSKVLLDHMQRDTLRLDVRPEPARPAALFERAADENRLIAERQGVTFETDFDGDAGPVHTDPRLAGQVLQNLVSNAVAFSPEGGTVTLRTARANGHVAFSVRDEGKGMSEEEQETLFEPFQTGAARRERAGDATPFDPETLPDGGFGLGLWIAQTFTKLLGGTLVVDSAPGEGTTFEVRLPQEARHEPSSAPSEATADSPSATAFR